MRFQPLPKRDLYGRDKWLYLQLYSRIYREKLRPRYDRCVNKHFRNYFEFSKIAFFVKNGPL